MIKLHSCFGLSIRKDCFMYVHQWKTYPYNTQFVEFGHFVCNRVKSYCRLGLFWFWHSTAWVAINLIASSLIKILLEKASGAPTANQSVHLRLKLFSLCFHFLATFGPFLAILWQSKTSRQDIMNAQGDIYIYWAHVLRHNQGRQLLFIQYIWRHESFLGFYAQDSQCWIW